MGCYCSRAKVYSTYPAPGLSIPATQATGGTSTLAPVNGIKLHPGQFIQRYDGSFYQHYDVVRVLGEGAFGKVYLAEHQITHQLRAVKVISKLEHKLSTTDLIAEVQTLAKLDHPHILKLYELYVSSESIAVVSEYLAGGELFEYLIHSGKTSEKQAAHILQQVLSAISYCHAHGVVHRDLKPENLMLAQPVTSGKEMIVKIIDFGASCLLVPAQHMEKMTGTSFYIAPEVLDRNYDEKCDVWSCGVILYTLLAGFPPFNGNTISQVLQAVRNSKVSFRHPEFQLVSDQAKRLIKRMLKKRPQYRLTAIDALHDSWIEENRWHSDSLSSQTLQSLANLQRFRSRIQLKKAVMAFIASHMLTRTQDLQMKDVFEALDLDGDGRLSREDLVQIYAKETSEAKAIVIVEALMKEVDADNNGFIDYTEFLTASINAQILLSRSNLKAAFDTIDKDGSGKISILELKSAFDASRSIDANVWKALVLEADPSHVGEIDIEEFFRLMSESVYDNRIV